MRRPSGRGRPRLLVVADEWPWPDDSGYRQRLDNIVRALASVGDVDYLAAVPDPADVLARSAVPSVVHQAYVVAAPWLTGAGHRLRRWVASADPWSVVTRDWSSARAQLASLVPRDYDVVWFSHCPAIVALGDLVPTPGTLRVLDVDDVPTAVLRSRLRAGRRGWTVRDWLRWALALVDLGRWRRAEARFGRVADRIVVCSELDSHRIRSGSATVLANGYTASGAPAARTVSDPPVVVMVGTLGYEPNRDSAAWFVQQVLPRLRRDVPDVRFRIVGSTGGRADVRALAEVEGVDVTGHVEEVASHLTDARVSVAPIRFGGGTRIKILEAFAYRIPVVTTTVGCEGLDVEPGVHVLVADTAKEFSDACHRLLTDPMLAHRIAAAGHALYQASYRWDLLRADVHDFAADLVATARADAGQSPTTATDVDADPVASVVMPRSAGTSSA